MATTYTELAVGNSDHVARKLVLWATLFCINILSVVPWSHVDFPTVDLAAIVFDVARLRAGYVPYLDTFNHHFGGYLVPFYLLAWIVPLTPPVLKVTAVSYNFVTAICIAATLREMGRREAASLGAFLTVTVGWFWNWQGYAFNIQSSIAPLLAAMMLMIARAAARDDRLALYAAGLLGGAVLCFDQRGLIFVPLVAGPLLFVPTLRSRSAWAGLTASVLLGPAACALYLWAVGAWSHFLRQTIIFPLFYRNHGIVDDVPFGLLWVRFLATTEPITVSLALLGIVCILICERLAWLRVIVPATCVCAAAYSLAGGRLFPNYFVLLGPPMLITISLLPSYLGPLAPRLGVITRYSLLAFAVFCSLKPLLLLLATGSVFVPPTESTVAAAAAYVREHSSKNDRILVWGFAPQIYVLSGRYNAFKDAGLLSITGGNFESVDSDDQGRLPEMVALFDDYLSNTPPKIVVDYALTTPAIGVCAGKGVMQLNLDYRKALHLNHLRTVLAASYTSAMMVTGPCDRAEVLVRKDEFGPGKPVPQSDQHGGG